MHFIKALKGGLLKKTLNVTRGKPVLRFKNVKDICEELDAKNGDLFPTIPPKDEFRGLHIDSARVMSERTNMGNAGIIRIKSEPEDSGFDCNDEGYSDLDCNLTLKQIQQTSKTKKRKRSKSIDLSEKLETCSPVKQEYSKLQANEENYDLLEPLSNLKSKLSKNAKAKIKSKRMKNCASTISQSAMITIKSEQIPSEVMPACERDVKVEVPEPGCSDFQNTSCFVDDTSLVYDNQVGYCGEVPTELPMTAAERASMNGWSIFPTVENQSCIVYEPFCEDMEYDPMPLQIVSNSGWDMVEADDTEMTSYECLDFWPALESKIEGYITNSVHPDLFIEAMPSENAISSEDAMLCQINSETKDDLYHCMEPVKGTNACISEANSTDDLPSNHGSSANSVSDCDLGSGSCLVSVADQFPMSKEEEKQSQLSACDDVKISSSPGINSCKATDERITAASGGYLKQQRPQRLFPTRKVHGVYWFIFTLILPWRLFII